jgi:CheY-like chemotaxis protein
MTRSKAVRNQPAVVFYVDDNPRSRRLLTSVLEDSGFDVVTADSGIEALGMCKNISFDVALIDYQMPLISGGQLAEEIKVLKPDVPVVLLSGRISIPKEALVFVDASLGPGTTLDDLLEKLRILAGVDSHIVGVQRSRTPWSDST